MANQGVLNIKDADGNFQPIEYIRGPRGYEGKPGKSGVHIGDNAPLDDDVQVWINTSGEYGDPSEYLENFTPEKMMEMINKYEELKTVIGRISFYGNISELNITSYYIPNIITAMPARSIFIDKVEKEDDTYTNTSISNKLPTSYGIIQFIKYNSSFVKIFFFSHISDSDNSMYICNYNTITKTIKGWDKLVTKEELSKMIIIKENIEITVDSWVNDSTYKDYPYKADIFITNVTEEHLSEVNFDISEILDGIYAPVAKSGNGMVTIYASEIPSSNITIPSVKCIKEI